MDFTFDLDCGRETSGMAAMERRTDAVAARACVRTHADSFMIIKKLNKKQDDDDVSVYLKLSHTYTRMRTHW